MPDRHGGPTCGLCHVVKSIFIKYISEPWFKYMKPIMHPIEHTLLEKGGKSITFK